MAQEREDWMQPVDDEILEIIQEHGNLTPAAIEKFGGPSADHASRRCKKLAEHGLLDQIVTGLYTITEKGLKYTV